MVRSFHSFILLACTAVAFLTLGKAPGAVTLREVDLAPIVITTAET